MPDPLVPADEGTPATSTHETPPAMDRRSFLVWAAGASLGVSVLFMGATVVQALSPPARSIEGKTKVGALPVAKLADLQTGVPTLVDYGDDSVFVVKNSPTQVHVLDAACPHVRCKLAWNPANKQFDCPCHASSFDINGVKLGGPAPRNMYGANFQIANGQVVVTGLEG